MLMIKRTQLNNAKSRLMGMSIRPILILFIFTLSTFSSAETIKDWDFDNGAITTEGEDLFNRQWDSVHTSIAVQGEDVFFTWHLMPKNRFEPCKLGYDDNAKETVLVVNGEVISGYAGCNKDKGWTFYSLVVADGHHLNRVVKTFKNSSLVNIKHELADFYVSATGFTAVWNKKTENLKAPIIIDLLESVKMKAKNGDLSSQLYLGFCYATGDGGCPQNYKLAFKWNELAAQQGSADGQMTMGKMYSSGSGVAQDFKKSFTWFRKAAEQGQVASQYQLGVIYILGKSVPKDPVISHMWFNLAAANGYTQAEEGREQVEAMLSQRQLEEAYRLARQCYTNNYKSC